MFSKRIIISYVKSTRPYLFFVSGMAGLLGIVFSETIASCGRTICILIVLFLGWGVNQVINDLLGLREDRINAPHRPLVSGELPIKAAVVISLLLFAGGGLVTFLLNPQALFIYSAIFLMNFIYEYSKSVPVLGNFIFGFLLALCVYYGAVCLSPRGLDAFLDKKLLLLAISVVLINITTAFYTYYKDARGDYLAGKKTIIVCLKPDRARYLNFIVSLLPFVIVPALLFSPAWNEKINIYFIAFLFLSFVILQYTALLFFKHPRGPQTYFSLRWNFTGAVLFKTSFVALVNPLLAGVLFLANFILIKFLFKLHSDYLV
ncbi:MAG: UbiA family prenyltransferase [Candidatus Omnitrophica bacterium]|nr:UbiA family prenyltransferase [Candidatus Omnitrophota bacterium]